MDFIFDEFIEIKDKNGEIGWLSASSVAAIFPDGIDTCHVLLKGGTVLKDIQMPHQVLKHRINIARKASYEKWCKGCKR